MKGEKNIWLLIYKVFGHFQQDINNQDFAIETSKFILLLDGCSEAKYSESGTRLFSQLFKTLDDYENMEDFESNIKRTFDKLISQLKGWYKNTNELEEFIMDNLLFTMIACFDSNDSFIVKIFGDGYIVSQNVNGNISYIKLSYGKRPPYFAYKYCSSKIKKLYKDLEFKTFTFSKDKFKKVRNSNRWNYAYC